MLHSFLTITLRILWRNKVTSFVNIFGLSVGITAFIFISLYIYHETSYDKFHSNYDRIYRLEGDDYAKLPPLFGRHLKNNLSEVENVAFLAMNFKNFISYTPENNSERKKEIEVNTAHADSTTFSVFSFTFLKGDPKSALAEPMTCVLTTGTAEKLFGDIDPINKTIECNKAQYLVTGIIENVKSSHVEIDILLSMSSFEKTDPQFNVNRTFHSWTWSATYLLAAPGVSPTVLEEKINNALSEINNAKLVDTDFERFHIRPLGDLYLTGAMKKLSYGLQGNWKNIMILSFVGVFLLILACVNYINLTTARSATRAKEIAIKRITGSSGFLIRLQLMGESVVLTFISLALAFTLVQLYLRKFNELLSIDVQPPNWSQPSSWFALLAAGLLIGILAGIYPAIYLTAKTPARLIRGETPFYHSGLAFRNVLMVFQFGLSLVLIVSVLVNFRQLHFLRNADLGFDQEQILVLTTSDGSPERYALRNTFKQNLIKQAGVSHISYSTAIPGLPNFHEMPAIEVNGVKIKMKGIIVDEDYIGVMGLSLSDGRNFTDQEQWDKPRIIINETAAKELGLDKAVGEVAHTGDSSHRPIEIIGVVKDFHVTGFHDKIEPLMLIGSNVPMRGLAIKISSPNINTTIEAIEKEWKNVWGDATFQYSFLDENFNRQYERDEQLAKVIGYFTILAVIIACLGLFALSSFMVSRRVKEIGVRKVLGASVATIYSMLSWDFLKWVLLAIVLASPVAWYLMKIWLETFAYHITLGADVFIIAALLAIGIALLTVTVQSLKVARANPVDALKYE